jgi:hypothetical protein
MHHPGNGAHLNELMRSLASACAISGEIIFVRGGALSAAAARGA